MQKDKFNARIYFNTILRIIYYIKFLSDCYGSPVKVKY